MFRCNAFSERETLTFSKFFVNFCLWGVTPFDVMARPKKSTSFSPN